MFRKPSTSVQSIRRSNGNADAARHQSVDAHDAVGLVERVAHLHTQALDAHCRVSVTATFLPVRVVIGRMSAAIVSRNEMGEAAGRERAPEIARWARQVTQMSGGVPLGLATLSASAIV